MINVGTGRWGPVRSWSRLACGAVPSSLLSGAGRRVGAAAVVLRGWCCAAAAVGVCVCVCVRVCARCVPCKRIPPPVSKLGKVQSQGNPESRESKTQRNKVEMKRGQIIKEV